IWGTTRRCRWPTAWPARSRTSPDACLNRRPRGPSPMAHSGVDGRRVKPMAGPTPTPRTMVLPAELSEIAARVEARLTLLLDDERRRWSALDGSLAEPLEALAGLVLSGGKRLRPAFCHWGFVVAGGDPADPK